MHVEFEKLQNKKRGRRKEANEDIYIYWKLVQWNLTTNYANWMNGCMDLSPKNVYLVIKKREKIKHRHPSEYPWNTSKHAFVWSETKSISSDAEPLEFNSSVPCITAYHSIPYYIHLSWSTYEKLTNAHKTIERKRDTHPQTNKQANKKTFF